LPVTIRSAILDSGSSQEPRTDDGTIASGVSRSHQFSILRAGSRQRFSRKLSLWLVLAETKRRFT